MNAVERLFPPKPQTVLELKAGSAVPSFEESAVHKGATDALDAISRVLGFGDETKASFLSTKDGKELRNLLRRFVAHGTIEAMEQ